jgi:hypothetical protein
MCNDVCNVDGCERPRLYRNGMCRTHYIRFKKYGDTSVVKQPQIALIDFVDVAGCFICTSHKLSKVGYPEIWRNKKKYIMSRFIYEQCFGPIAEGLVVRHKCDNRGCINPEHLELGTQADNMQDMVIRGRNAMGEKCGASKLTEENIKEIRLLLSKGMKVREVSAKFNVTDHAIRDIRRRKTWKHID